MWGCMEQIKQLSTHLQRQDRRLDDDWLEIWLEDWGAFQREPIRELATPHRTSLKIAEEMKPEMVQSAIPQCYYQNGKPCPQWLNRIIYECQWHKNHKSTHSFYGNTPNYMPHHRMDKLSRIIQQLKPIYQEIIYLRYEKQLNARDISHIKNDAYFWRVRRAKELIYANLTKN